MNLDKSQSFGIDNVLFCISCIMGVISLFIIYSADITRLYSIPESLLSYSYISHIILIVICFISLICFKSVKYIYFQEYSKYLYILLILYFLLIQFQLDISIDHLRGKNNKEIYYFINPNAVFEFILILFLSYFLSLDKVNIKKFSYFSLLNILILVPLLFFLQILYLSGFVLILLVTFFMLFIAGARYHHLSILFFAFPFLIASMAVFSKPLSVYTSHWLDPWKSPLTDGHEIINSFLSFGAGGLSGVGYNNGFQKHYFLADPTGYSILAHIGEEHGLIGVIIILLLFAVIVFRGYLISCRSDNLFCKYFSFGLTTWIGLKTLLYFFSSLGLFPTSSLMLPFIASEGISTLIYYTSIGSLLSISHDTYQYQKYPIFYRHACDIYTKLIKSRFKLSIASFETHVFYKIISILAVLMTLIYSFLDASKYLFAMLIGK
jgi:cell division protein FtsW